MADRVSTSDSYEDLRRFCARTQASLLAYEALSPQAAAWESVADDTLAVHVAAMKAEDELEAAAITERLALLEWKRAFDALAGASAGAAAAAGSAHAALDASIATIRALSPRLGAAATLKVGRELVALARVIEGELAAALAPHVAELEAATVRVEVATNTREEEPEHVFGFKLAKVQIVRKINALVDETCIFTLKTLPDRADLLDELFGET